MSDRREMSARISCTPEVQGLIREICKGADVNYDDFLRYVLTQIGIEPESSDKKALLFGLKLRGDIPKFVEGEDE